MPVPSTDMICAPANPRNLRDACGCYVTGVAAVLVDDDAGQPHGLTINSFTSVSLDPPLIVWSLARRSNLLPLFARTQHFSVNILCAAQRQLAETLSHAHTHSVPKAQWRRGKTRAPILPSSLVSLECRICERLNGGDHVMFLSRVVHIHRSAQTTSAALVYAGGKYRSLA